MNKTLKSILEVMQSQTKPIKLKDLIFATYRQKQINITHNHLSILMGKNKIEKVGIGMYQAK